MVGVVGGGCAGMVDVWSGGCYDYYSESDPNRYHPDTQQGFPLPAAQSSQDTLQVGAVGGGCVGVVDVWSGGCYDYSNESDPDIT